MARIQGYRRFLASYRGLAALFLLTRAIAVVAALVAEGLILPQGQTRGAPILGSLTAWDGFFYLDIAVNGYSPDPVAGAYANVAFPPLYPALVALTSLVTPLPAGVAGIVVANAAFAVALILLVRLGVPYVGAERSFVAAGLLVVYPFASVYAMAYAESLFLMLMLATFLAAERRSRMMTGLLFALTTLCRLQGVALLLPLALIMLRQDRWRPRPSVAWLLLGPFAAGAFVLFVAWLTGDVSGFLDAQQAWGREGIGGSEVDETVTALFSPYQAALLATLLWSTYLLVFVRVDKMRAEYVLVPVSFMAAAILSGSLESVGRITMSAFPLVWILASRRSALATRVWPAVSLALFTAVALLTFSRVWVP